MIDSADTLGISAVSVSSVAMITSISVSSLLSTTSSPQLMFALFGYYQMLLTILLLRYQIPETLKEFISNFGIFKLD
jgi:hypothetical protein